MDSLEKQLRRKANLMRTPISATFELLPLCNMNCRMCYVRMSREEMEAQGSIKPMEWWLALAEDMKKAGVLFLLLTGGEPFLYPDFITLYRRLAEMGFIISINTNGLLLNEEIADVLAEVRPRQLNVSLYGSSDAIYEQLCGEKQGFTKLCRSLTLLDERKLTYRFNVALTPYNCDDMMHMLQFAMDRNITSAIADYIFLPERRTVTEEFLKQQRLPAKVAAQYSIQIDKFQKTKEELQQFVDQMLLKVEKNRCIQDDFVTGFHCSGGRSAFWINWKGEMLPCGMLNVPSADVNELGMEAAWKQISDIIRETELSRECFYCDKRDICGSCGAIAYAETGSFDGTPTYRCQLTKLKYEKYLELQESLGRNEE